MGKKKKAKKGINSLLKQIRIHALKLKEAKAKGHYGFEKYTIKEIRSFGKEALKRKLRTMPRTKRIKYKKKLKKKRN